MQGDVQRVTLQHELSFQRCLHVTCYHRFTPFLARRFNGLFPEIELLAQRFQNLPVEHRTSDPWGWPQLAVTGLQRTQHIDLAQAIRHMLVVI